MFGNNVGQHVVGQAGHLISFRTTKEFWTRNAKAEDRDIDTRAVHVRQFPLHVLGSRRQRHAQALTTVKVIGAIYEPRVGKVATLLQHARYFFRQEMGMDIDAHSSPPLRSFSPIVAWMLRTLQVSRYSCLCHTSACCQEKPSFYGHRRRFLLSVCQDRPGVPPQPRRGVQRRDYGRDETSSPLWDPDTAAARLLARDALALAGGGHAGV